MLNNMSQTELCNEARQKLIFTVAHREAALCLRKLRQTWSLYTLFICIVKINWSGTCLHRSRARSPRAELRDLSIINSISKFSNFFLLSPAHFSRTIKKFGWVECSHYLVKHKWREWKSFVLSRQLVNCRSTPVERWARTELLVGMNSCQYICC